MQADPPSIAARGCRGREKPADSEAGQTSRAARQAVAEPGVQPSEGELRCVNRHVRGGGNAEEEPEAWLWCRRRQVSRNTSGGMCRSAGDACNICGPGNCAAG